MHREIFKQTLSQDGNQSFTVVLQKQGLEVTSPSDKSVLDVLLDHNIDIECSCEQGVCGTCLTPVISGDIDHRDSFLTTAEKQANNVFTPCCSRAKSTHLVLDL